MSRCPRAELEMQVPSRACSDMQRVQHAWPQTPAKNKGTLYIQARVSSASLPMPPRVHWTLQSWGGENWKSGVKIKVLWGFVEKDGGYERLYH